MRAVRVTPADPVTAAHSEAVSAEQPDSEAVSAEQPDSEVTSAERKQGLAVEDVDLTPEPGEVLLKVHDCGICGTDLHTLRYPDVFNTQPGTILGHEFAGEIAEITTGVSGWQRGDRVVSLPVMNCGECAECTSGYDWHCVRALGHGLSLAAIPGAFAEYVRASPHALLPIPDTLSNRHAALTEPLAVALHSLNRVRLQAGEPCIIMGAGPVGLFTLVWAKLLRSGERGAKIRRSGERGAKVQGAAPIVVSDPAPARRALALALGADAAVDPTQSNPTATLRELANGHYPAVVFECVGTPPALQEAMRMAGRNGRIFVTGVCLQPYELRPMTAHGKELEVHYVFAYTRSEFQESLNALARGDVPADQLISNVITLDEVPAMFEQLAQPTTQVKVLVEPHLSR